MRRPYDEWCLREGLSGDVPFASVALHHLRALLGMKVPGNKQEFATSTAFYLVHAAAEISGTVAADKDAPFDCRCRAAAILAAYGDWSASVDCSPHLLRSILQEPVPGERWTRVYYLDLIAILVRSDHLYGVLRPELLSATRRLLSALGVDNPEIRGRRGLLQYLRQAKSLLRLSVSTPAAVSTLDTGKP